MLVVEDIPLLGTFAQFTRVGGTGFTGACISLIFDHKLIVYNMDNFESDIIELGLVIKLVLLCKTVDDQLANMVDFVSTDFHCSIVDLKNEAAFAGEFGFYELKRPAIVHHPPIVLVSIRL